MNNKEIILSETSSDEFQESFNILRTNINFALCGEKSKLIALTSANNGEGVSTTALNLALSFSQIDNNKVLLIDGDMHSSVLTQKLELSEKAGFSDCLSGNEEKEKCIVSKFGIDILPAGKKPSNPANLFDSIAMDTLCNNLRSSYDYVFLILPPAVSVSDTAISAKFVDGFVAVVRHNATRFVQIKALLKTLNFAGGRVLGFVYNKAHI